MDEARIPPDDDVAEAVAEMAADLAPPQAGEAPLALYRRYRPDVFSEIIGQEQVTEPLRRALLNNRVNHAYLFSGPRGCGKTSSARILARALNCVQGPTPDPCGVCDSCVALARGGPGSLDVIEIDAASHGGVDDARDLRERAFFAPVQSRFKIYIVDEAHMVTTAGFNALLKLVEEPPPHVKFIFATTEPDKVIGTIRSRTHHYPFRLVPPKVMGAFLADICAQEHVEAEAGVIPLVVRAGAGSVRDSLSVLDQLLGAADADGVHYRQAAALLGYTPDSLLDEFVDALAAHDAHGVFTSIDKVIEAGQDPRRFTEDLLRRLRDLVIVAAVPDSLTNGLIDVAADQAERYLIAAQAIGAPELTRAAEVLASGLTAMRGTTAPRLHLELMCSRILVPGSDAGERGLTSRIERIERRLALLDQGATPGEGEGVPAEPVQPVQAPKRDHDHGSMSQISPPPPAPPSPSPAPVRSAASPVSAPSDSSAPSPGAPTGLTTADLRRGWPQILDEVKVRRKFIWMILTQFAQVTEVTGGEVWLTFADPGSRENFNRSGGEETVRDAITAAFGAKLAVRARIESEPIPGSGFSGAPASSRANTATSTSVSSQAGKQTGALAASSSFTPDDEVPSSPAPIPTSVPPQAASSIPPSEPSAGPSRPSVAGEPGLEAPGIARSVETPPDPADEEPPFVSHRPPLADLASDAPLDPPRDDVSPSALTPASRRSGGRSSSAGRGKRPPKPADEPAPETSPDDEASPDDAIVENPIDEAEQLIRETLGAELVKEEER
ncbi:MAG: DNA polymerase III subunit gamma and tau [Propionibacteriaceae bacterium]|jgi:DNA polymerase-3 subunit gamma/tau|nr:DNA polymerase III subunit gamma and tau [Propionibacteriaceae bacterium]